jgi:hypothetical protein
VLHLRLTRMGYDHIVQAIDDRGVLHRVSVQPAS